MFLLWLWYMMPWIGAVVMTRLCWRAPGPILNELDHNNGDEEDDEEDAPSTAEGSGPGGSLAVLAEGAAAVPPAAGVDKKQEHRSGVWGRFSPTGFPVARERTAEMDHTNGKPWEVEVWNPLEDPLGGNEEVNFQSVPRYYEQKNRAMMTVAHMVTMCLWRMMSWRGSKPGDERRR